MCGGPCLYFWLCVITDKMRALALASIACAAHMYEACIIENLNFFVDKKSVKKKRYMIRPKIFYWGKCAPKVIVATWYIKCVVNSNHKYFFFDTFM